MLYASVVNLYPRTTPRQQLSYTAVGAYLLVPHSVSVAISSVSAYTAPFTGNARTPVTSSALPSGVNA